MSKKLISRLVYILYLIIIIIATLFAFNSYKAFKFHDIYVNHERWPDHSRRYNSSIGFEMTPSYSAFIRNQFHIKSHHLGYRIPLFQNDSAFKKNGIFFTGCSFTYGDEQEAENTFPYFTEESLKIPVYNYGVCGYSYASVLLQLKDLENKKIFDTLQPKYLVLGTGDWLINRSLSPFYPTTHLQLAYPYIGRQDNNISILNPSDFYSIKHLYELKEAYGDHTTNKKMSLSRFAAMSYLVPRVIAANAKSKNWKSNISSKELYDFLFTELEKFCSKHNMKLIILWMTADKDGKLEQGISNAADKHQINIIDGSEALKEYNVNPSEYIDRHPGSSAHKAYANAVIEEIRKEEF